MPAGNRDSGSLHSGPIGQVGAEPEDLELIGTRVDRGYLHVHRAGEKLSECLLQRFCCLETQLNQVGVVHRQLTRCF
jgi:hypothetical protein